MHDILYLGKIWKEKQPLHAIFVRYSGELAIKNGKLSRQLVDRLIHRISLGLEYRGVHFTVRQEFSCLIVSVNEKQKALNILAKIFGISSYSPVELCIESDFSAIVSASKHMISFIEGKRFCGEGQANGWGQF